MPEYKGCPLLVQSDTYPSLTMRGESHTRTYMLECIAGKCAAFRADSEFCDKFMACVRLPKSAPAQKFENESIRGRFTAAFPKFYINHNLEAIVHPRRNSYFLLADVHTEKDLIAKILEWLSREASKSITKESQKYHLDGINAYLGTNFSQEDMVQIYTYLGNRCNHKRTLRFIESGYDLSVLVKEGENGV